jgi:hypothetical protein
MQKFLWANRQSCWIIKTHNCNCLQMQNPAIDAQNFLHDDYFGDVLNPDTCKSDYNQL